MKPKLTRKLSRSVILAALALSVACTTSQTEVPGLSGPSTTGLSLRLTATPDSILQDGVARSTIDITAYNSSGKTCASLPVHMDTGIDGQVQDFGSLSRRDVTTDGNGRVQVVYTAPPPPPASGGSANTTVTIFATPSTVLNCDNPGNQPVVGNFEAANRQQVAIRLVPPGIILPDADFPTPKIFVVQPVLINTPTFFDGSTSCPRGVDGSGACLPSSAAGSTIVTYLWTFVGELSTTGPTAVHTYTSAGTKTVILTVTNDRGKTTQSAPFNFTVRDDTNQTTSNGNGGRTTTRVTAAAVPEHVR